MWIAVNQLCGTIVQSQELGSPKSMPIDMLPILLTAATADVLSVFINTRVLYHGAVFSNQFAQPEAPDYKCVWSAPLQKVDRSLVFPIGCCKTLDADNEALVLIVTDGFGLITGPKEFVEFPPQQFL